MADQSFVSVPSAFAGALARGLNDRATRQKNLRRSAALAAVALVHVVFLFFLILPQIEPPLVRVPVEVPLVLMPLPRPVAVAPPRVINAKKPLEKEKVRTFQPAPITLAPAPPVQNTETNALRALGVELACGASRYEYLSPAEKKLCRHAPWTMRPDRNLALGPPPQPLPGHMTGAEAAARLRETASPCPPSNNGTPCLDEIVHGKGPH